MGGLDLQQKNTFALGREETTAFKDSQDAPTVVCPIPRRLGPVINNPMTILRGDMMSHQPEVYSPRAGMELLDILLKNGCGGEQFATQLATSPPFFTGSPPARTVNPLIHDARFGDEKLCLVPSPSNLCSSSCTGGGGGGARMSFGQKPAVRIEGFDYLNRDSQNSRITAFA